jgi:hypothetical protein
MTVAVDEGAGERLADLFGDGSAAEDGARQPVELPPYGYRWFRVVGGPWRSR